MPLELPNDAACFVDANILYYHFVESPPFSEPCTRFLERAAHRNIQAFTTTHILAEAMHKIMLAQAAAQFDLKRPSLVNWLQSNRHRIAELTPLRDLIEELCDAPLACLPLSKSVIPRAAKMAIAHSLLTNDAITLAIMHDQGLTHLVTNDDDFDHIPAVRVWKPR